ncbi:MAG: TOTE conflict system archaeo-eukaryotic primase domain-containing protein [Brachybacterium sp.]
MAPCVLQPQRGVRIRPTARWGRAGHILRSPRCCASQGPPRAYDRRPPSAHQPLSTAVLSQHLRSDERSHIGLYPLLHDNTCWFLAADLDGKTALIDALAVVKAARANGIAAGLELSQSGRGAHVWIFFTDAVPAATARSMGTFLLHEAMGMRGSMDLRSYDRLFPNQDVMPSGGFGNLIAAPLEGRKRRDGLTVFLDVSTLEPGGVFHSKLL